MQGSLHKAQQALGVPELEDNSYSREHRQDIPLQVVPEEGSSRVEVVVVASLGSQEWELLQRTAVEEGGRGIHIHLGQEGSMT